MPSTACRSLVPEIVVPSVWPSRLLPQLVGAASNLLFAVLIGFGHPILLAVSIKRSCLQTVPRRFDNENTMSTVPNP
jgi:hypothetical protein